MTTSVSYSPLIGSSFKHQLFSKFWSEPGGHHKLRHCFKHPLLNRLRYYASAAVADQWELLPSRLFWAVVRAEAERQEISMREAFILLADAEIDLTNLPATPHPLLGMR